mgnify:CR=1 FL=1
MIALLGMYALFASTFILGQQAVSLVPPLFFVGIRMLLAGLLLLGYVKLYTKKSLHIKPSHYGWFAGIVIFHIYFSYVLEFVSYVYLPGSYVAFVYNLSPFITALFAYFFLTEIMTPKKWIGLILGFVASIPLIVTQTTAAAPVASTTGMWTVLAQIALLLSVISTCVGWIFLKKMTSTFNYSYVFVNGIGMFFGGIISLATSYFLEPLPSLIFITTDTLFLTTLFLSIIIGNVIVYNLYGKLLQTYSATALSLFGCTTPLFAALIDWFWLGKMVGPLFVVTTIATAIGLYIFYQEELKGTITNPVIEELEQGR